MEAPKEKRIDAALRFRVRWGRELRGDDPHSVLISSPRGTIQALPEIKLSIQQLYKVL